MTNFQPHATVWGTGGPEFKSRRSDQMLLWQRLLVRLEYLLHHEAPALPETPARIFKTSYCGCV
jgi:hypothetical protein